MGHVEGLQGWLITIYSGPAWCLQSICFIIIHELIHTFEWFLYIFYAKVKWLREGGKEEERKWKRDRKTDLRYITTSCNVWTLIRLCFLQTNYRASYEKTTELWKQNIDNTMSCHFLNCYNNTIVMLAEDKVLSFGEIHKNLYKWNYIMSVICFTIILGGCSEWV